MKEYIEKEIKLKVDDVENVLRSLKQHGAQFEGGALERTIRFDNENKDYEKAGKFFRVRSGFKNTVTLKEKIAGGDKNVRARKETEFEVEDIDKMAYVFNVLGLNYSMTMEKYRQHWNYGGCDVTLDELPFGVFMEIEGEENAISEVCKSLGLDESKKILVTYWELWAEISNKKDIIFEANHKFKLK